MAESFGGFDLDTFLEDMLGRAPVAIRAQLTQWAKQNGVLPGQEIHDEELPIDERGVWRCRAWLLPCEPQCVFVLITYLSGDVPESCPLSWSRSVVVAGPVDVHIRQIQAAFVAVAKGSLSV